MDQQNVAADLRLCDERMQDLNTFEQRLVARLHSYGGQGTSEELHLLANIAARLRAEATTREHEGPSADVIPFEPKKPKKS